MGEEERRSNDSKAGPRGERERVVLAVTLEFAATKKERAHVMLILRKKKKEDSIK